MYYDVHKMEVHLEVLPDLIRMLIQNVFSLPHDRLMEWMSQFRNLEGLYHKFQALKEEQGRFDDLVGKTVEEENLLNLFLAQKEKKKRKNCLSSVGEKLVQALFPESSLLEYLGKIEASLDPKSKSITYNQNRGVVNQIYDLIFSVFTTGTPLSQIGPAIGRGELSPKCKDFLECQRPTVQEFFKKNFEVWSLIIFVCESSCVNTNFGVK
tara:strand:- start:411 stop:1040 length:630 start_codon:yes stop_codon:yes gene_type:complete